MTDVTTTARRPPTLEELRARRDEILEVARRRGASNVAVFGSTARGDADEKSDVDFLVDLEPARSLWDLGALLAELRDVLGCEVDVVTRKGLRQRIRERVLAEAAGTLRSDRERLEDILEACGSLRRIVAPRVGDLEDDQVLRLATERLIEIIGEAATNVSAELRARHPEVDWVARRGKVISLDGTMRPRVAVLRHWRLGARV